jgi:hypothetical protein
MIQRQQTLWLILSALAALLSFMFPFVTGKGIENNLPVDKSIKAGSDFLLLIFTGASLVIAVITIFLYKDRKMQIRLSLLGMLIAAVIILLFILQMNKITQSTLALFCVLPFAGLIGYFMAFRNIRKDEKLIKSLDKLR